MLPTITWQWKRFAELTSVELYALLAARGAVFVVEQRCAYLDADGLDVCAWHLLGCAQRNGERVLAAYLRLVEPGRKFDEPSIGRVLFFIGSLTRTTVANTFVLMSVSPFLAAIAGRLLLREAVPWRTWLAMAVAFAGIMVMFSESLDRGRLAGNLLALGVSCCFALNVTMLRKFHASTDMLPTVMLAAIWSLVPAFFLAGPFAANGRDLAILAFMGCVQLGTGCLLMTAASKHLTATELGLLALLEPILGPIWVWAILGEHPGALALSGGVVVLAAVIANEVFAAYWARGTMAQPP